MMNGIIANASIINVTNSQFLKMSRDILFEVQALTGEEDTFHSRGGRHTGRGIYANYGSRIDIKGLGIGESPPTFEECENGAIHSVSSYPIVKDAIFNQNYIKDVSTGGNFAHGAKIMNNHFIREDDENIVSNFYNSIVKGGGNLGKAEIADNKFDTWGNVSIAVFSNNLVHSNFSISNNTFNFSSRSNSINNQFNGDGAIFYHSRSPNPTYYIGENTIDISDAQFGIQLTGNTTPASGWISANRIVDQDDSYSAIQIAATNNVHVCRDTTEDSEIGIEYLFGSMISDLAENNINDHDIGLRISHNTSIGRQYQKLNCWKGTYDPTGAVHIGNIISNERIIVNDDLRSCYFPTRSPSFWFINDENDTDTVGCDFPKPIVESLFDTLVANQSFYDSSYTRYYILESNRRLLSILHLDSMLKGTNQLLSNYYSTFEDSVIFKLSKIDYIINHYAESDTNSINSFLLKSDSLETAIHQADSLNGVYLDGEDTTDLNNLYTAVFLMHELQSRIDTIQKELIEKLLQGIDSAEVINESIITNDSLELLEVEANDYLFLKLRGELDTLTSTQSDFLNSLANLCPIEYGNGVFKAQWILGTEWVSTGNDPCADPNQQAIKVNTLDDVKEAGPLSKVYPNPTSNNIHVLLSEKLELPVRIELSDINGRLLHSQLYNQKRILINMRSLNIDQRQVILSINDKLGKRDHHKVIIVNE